MSLLVPKVLVPEVPQPGSCSSFIPAGIMCAVNIQFLPSVVGPETATLIVASNSSAGPLLIILLGEGQKAVSQLGASTSALSLSSEMVNNYGESSFTLTNYGDTNVGIYAPLISGAGANNFYADLSACNAVLVPGSSCVATVSFAPANPGVSAAVLQIFSTASSTPLALTLAGIGN